MSINSWRALLLCKMQNCCILSANWKAPADFCVQSSFICCHLLDVKKPQSCRVCFFTTWEHISHIGFGTLDFTSDDLPDAIRATQLLGHTHSYSQFSISRPPNCMSLNCGGNWSTRRKRGEHADFKQKGLLQAQSGVKPGTFLLWDNSDTFLSKNH